MEFADSDGHYFFNSNSSAVGVADFNRRRNARRIAARKIQISGAKVSAAQNRTNRFGIAVADCNIDLVTECFFNPFIFSGRKTDQTGKAGRKERVKAGA